MDGRNKIVVGFDGSAESREAVRFALRDAARMGARILVVRVFEPPQDRPAPYGLYGLPRPPSLDELSTNIEATTRAAVEQVTAELDLQTGAVPVEVAALMGSPGKILVQQATQADALVLGHRGRGAFAGALLGSVGLHCLLHAACPVTIVRPVPRSGQGASAGVATAQV